MDKYAWRVVKEKLERNGRSIIKLILYYSTEESEYTDKNFFKIDLNKEIVSLLRDEDLVFMNPIDFNLMRERPELYEAVINQLVLSEFKVYQTDIENFQNGIEKREILTYKTAWLEYLSQGVPNQLIKQNSTLELLLILNFLQAAHQLIDPRISPRVSSKEKKDLLLRCYFNRLIILRELINNNLKESNFMESVITKIHQIYDLESNRLIQYLSEEDFSGYSPPSDLLKLFSSVFNKNCKNIDDLVDAVIFEYFDATHNKLKKGQKEGSSTSEEDQKLLKENADKIVNQFYLPRYKIWSPYRNLRRVHGWLGLLNINIIIPRLLAAITIGFLPLLLTGELYQWYYLMFMKDVDLLNRTVFWLAVIVGELVVSLYLYKEIKNYLGFISWKRFFNIFLIGNLFSFILSFIGSVLMGRHFIIDIINKDNAATVEPTYILMNLFDKGAPLSLILLQSVFSLFLGIIIQAVWEDKPITQPL